MKMRKKTFRIGELAKKLGIERFVIRFWEKEFQVKTDRSYGGQRFYTEDDYNLFANIKDLLYNRGFTIMGAKQEIKSFKNNQIKTEKNIVGSQKTTLQDKDILINVLKEERERLEKKIIILQQQLLKLRELL